MALQETYILCKNTHFQVKRIKITNIWWQWLLRHTARVLSVIHLKTRKTNIQRKIHCLCLQRWTKTDCCLNQESIFSPFSLTASWSLNELLTKKTPARNKTWPTIFVEVPSRIVMIMYFYWCLSREDTVRTLKDRKVIRKPQRESYYNCMSWKVRCSKIMNERNLTLFTK